MHYFPNNLIIVPQVRARLSRLTPRRTSSGARATRSSRSTSRYVFPVASGSWLDAQWVRSRARSFLQITPMTISGLVRSFAWDCLGSVLTFDTYPGRIKVGSGCLTVSNPNGADPHYAKVSPCQTNTEPPQSQLWQYGTSDDRGVVWWVCRSLRAYRQ